MKEKILNYWRGLQQRERWILIGGAAIVAMLLFHQLLWSPWHKAIDEMQMSLEGHRENLTWIRQHVEMLNEQVNETKEVLGRGDSLMSVIEKTARSAQIRDAIQKLTPRENNSQVSVVLEEASFNNWVRWVDTLQSDYAVTIIQLTAEREDKPDTAEIRVTFSRAQG